MEKKCELLSPAGSLEKLKFAFLYGADAVYIGGEEFGLRRAAENFSLQEMQEGIEHAHKLGKKVYVTANIIPHNEDVKGFAQYIKMIHEMQADAVIISDLGFFDIAKTTAPDLQIHISTQANIVNHQSAKMWHRLGAKRIVTARELNLHEIKEMRQNTPSDLEIEAFVHGAMCISYSGRCLLSNYMTGRDSNMGACAHPCRWKYYLMEEKRPGEYMPVLENERGTFIFNSKDLCMLNHISDLLDAGVTSFKIEGRVKSEYYVAAITKAYRVAIDACLNQKPFDERLMEEVHKVSHRGYTTGFYYGKPDEKQQVYTSSSYIREYDLIGYVKGYDKEKEEIIFEQRNRCFEGDEVEFLQPKGETIKMKLEGMRDKDNNPIQSAPHAMMEVRIKSEQKFPGNTIIRKKGAE